MLMRLGLIAGVIAMTAVACSSEQKQADTGGADAGGVPQVNPSNYPLNGQPSTVAGITFTPPSTWVDLGASGMRQASYYLAAVGGDADSATVTVFYFGQEGGGTIEANIERWIGQMATGPEDNPSQRAMRDTVQTDGMPVHLMTVGGTYSGSMGGPMGGGTGAKEGYEMMAAVVEGPEGNVFFKLTGPHATAKEMSGGFMAMVQSVKRSQ